MNKYTVFSRRTLLKTGTVSAVSALALGANIFSSASPAQAAVQRETWDVNGNGYAGQLIFPIVAAYTPAALPGTTYMGTAYGDPMLSYFASKGNNLYDMGFIRAATVDFSYFQLWFGEWNASTNVMSGQFYGVHRSGLQFSVDGPYNWNAKLIHGGSYDTFTNTSPTPYLLLSPQQRGASHPTYATASLFAYAGTANHQIVQGFNQYVGAPAYPMVGHIVGTNYSFIEAFQAGFASMQYYIGTRSDAVGYNLDGTRVTLYFNRNTRTITLPAGQALPWHTIKK